MLIHKRTLNIAKGASTDETRSALNGVLIEEGGRLTVTDGHILVTLQSISTAEESQFPDVPGVERSVMPLVPAILPTADALNLARRKDSHLAILNYLLVDTEFSNGNGSMKLGAVDNHLNSQVLQIKKVEGTFPDYAQVIPERAREGLHIGFKVAVFQKLLDTLKGLGVDSIDVQIPADAVSPIRVDATCDLGEVQAVIMPAKI